MSTTSTSNIPNDIILCVIDNLLFTDARSLRRISRQWRAMIQDHPVFWRDISLTAGMKDPVSLLRLCLRWSGDRRVHVAAHWSTRASQNFRTKVLEEVLRLVTVHLSHITALHVCGLSQNQPAIFPALQAIPLVPILRSLELLVGQPCEESSSHARIGGGSTADLPPQLPSTFRAPNLRAIRLVGTSLASLSAECCPAVVQVRLSRCSDCDWWTLRNLFPSAQDVEVDAVQDFDPPAAQSSAAVQPCWPQQKLDLLRQHMDLPTTALMVPHVVCRDSDTFHAITVDAFAKGEDLDVVHSLVRASHMTTNVSFVTSSIHVAIFGRINGRVRGMSSFPAFLAYGPPNFTLYAQIVSLDLHHRTLEYSTAFLRPDISMRSLTTLILRFDGGLNTFRSRGSRGRMRDHLPYISCPALRTVRLATTLKDAPGESMATSQISVEDLAALLQDVLVQHHDVSVFPLRLQPGEVTLLGQLSEGQSIFDLDLTDV